jgi:hypothetical protein
MHDAGRFRALYRDWRAVVREAAEEVLGSRDDAEDATQRAAAPVPELTLFGGLLGLAVPIPALTLDADSRWCRGGGPGEYECNHDLDRRDAGSETCHACCGPELICNPHDISKTLRP